MNAGNLSLEQLFIMQTAAKGELRAAQDRVRLTDAAVADALALRVEEAFRAKGKGNGSVAIEDGPFVISASASRRVEWDSPKLMTALMEHWDELKGVVVIEATIPEKVHSKLRPEVAALVEDARFVKFGERKVVVKMADEDEDDGDL